MNDGQIRRLIDALTQAQAATVNAALIHADLVRQRDEARAEVERLRAKLADRDA